MILIAGTPGFVGSALLARLARGVLLLLGASHAHPPQPGRLEQSGGFDRDLYYLPGSGEPDLLEADGEDLSTTDLLLRAMGQARGKPARLLTALLKVGAATVGKSELAQRLCGSLQVDISKTLQLLGWAPPLSVDEGLKKAAEGYWREASV